VETYPKRYVKYAQCMSHNFTKLHYNLSKFPSLASRTVTVKMDIACFWKEKFRLWYFRSSESVDYFRSSESVDSQTSSSVKWKIAGQSNGTITIFTQQISQESAVSSTFHKPGWWISSINTQKQNKKSEEMNKHHEIMLHQLCDVDSGRNRTVNLAHS
jgi:hypothetical protein